MNVEIDISGEVQHMNSCWKRLAAAMLAQAVEDMATLKAYGAITEQNTVDAHHFRHRYNAAGKSGGKRTPIGLEECDAVELVNFFRSDMLDRLCGFLDVPACRIRSKFNI
jgi:hypothetical protein